jgi:hypothetical protein
MQPEAAMHDTRILVAPFLGALGGFLLNRARGGAEGYAMLVEMLIGAGVVMAGAWVVYRLGRLAQEVASRRVAALEALVASEAERYRFQRMVFEQVALSEERRPDLGSVIERVRGLEETALLAREASERLVAIEQAQASLRQQQVEIDRRAAREAEEVKASLRQFTVTESQRQRNMQAPDNDQSGRIIELETRISELAGELQRLSGRSPAAGEAQPSTEAPADEARAGFLRAMLEANKTLRDRIREAA